MEFLPFVGSLYLTISLVKVDGCCRMLWEHFTQAVQSGCFGLRPAESIGKLAMCAEGYLEYILSKASIYVKVWSQEKVWLIQDLEEVCCKNGKKLEERKIKFLKPTP